MKKIILIFLVAVFVLGCAQDRETKVVKQVFLKKDIGDLPLCVVEHSECGDMEKRCVQVPEHLGGDRQCFRYDRLGDYFGCTAGELIFHPMEPWLLRCY